MRIKEVPMYKFEELTPERQKKEIDKHRNINVDYIDWDDYLREEFISDMEKKGYLITNKNLYCDYSCSQGSGASFTAKVDVMKVIDRWDPNGSNYPRLRSMWKEGLYEVNIVKTSSNYCHSYTMDVSIEDTGGEDRVENSDDDLNNLTETVIEGGSYIDKLSEISGDILKEAREEANKFHKLVEDAYLENMSDESIKESIICNDMEFEGRE